VISDVTQEDQQDKKTSGVLHPIARMSHYFSIY